MSTSLFFNLTGFNFLPSVMFNPQQFEDGVLDAVLMSMGRTMTQEDVRQLMQRTVQQVSLCCSERLVNDSAD